MDFDIGSLVYILLTILFIVIGSLGKKKKPQVQNNEPLSEEELQEDTPRGDLQSRMEKFLTDLQSGTDSQAEFSDEEVAEYYREKETTSAERESSREYPEYSEVYEQDESKLYKIEDHIKEIMENSNMVMEKRRTGKRSFVRRSLKEFDPKKAFLFSEVFGHKYF